MTKTDQLELDMIRLAELKGQMAVFDSIKAEYDEVRQAVLEGMQAQRSKRTETINGYFAVRQERANIRITDDSKVREWMVANDFPLDEYLRIDARRLDVVAKARLKEDGEIIDGCELDITESVTIRQEKE